MIPLKEGSRSLFLPSKQFQNTFLEAKSPEERLSRQTVDVEGLGQVGLTTPFRSGSSPVSRPTDIVIGVLGSENRIDIEQSIVKTAILYAGTQAEAELDLEINVGLGDNGPVSIPIGGELGAANGSFFIEDNVLVLDGNFARLSGIEATSTGGHLSFADDLTAPFAESAIRLDETNGQSLLLGVNTSAGRVDLEGLTTTAIRYNAGDDVALDDLTIRLGIAGQGTVAIQHMDAVVPEPASNLLASAALWSLLLFRKRARLGLSQQRCN